MLWWNEWSLVKPCSRFASWTDNQRWRGLCYGRPTSLLLKASPLPALLLFVLLIHFHYTPLSLLKLWVNSAIHFTWTKHCADRTLPIWQKSGHLNYTFQASSLYIALRSWRLWPAWGSTSSGLRNNVLYYSNCLERPSLNNQNCRLFYCLFRFTRATFGTFILMILVLFVYLSVCNVWSLLSLRRLAALRRVQTTATI